MKRAGITKPGGYRSPLRAKQSQQTRQRLQQAMAELLREQGAAEGITFRAVAERAAVTEMTVYRHFPSRDALLQGLWQHLNEQMGPSIGMPQSAADLLRQHRELFGGFDRVAPQIVASITTPQGREMRGALNKQRRKAFLAIVGELAPRLPSRQKQRAAAILQLLHSAYAWDSLHQNWGFDGVESGEATQWAIELLINQLRTQS